jgi:hypothetical protein
METTVLQDVVNKKTLNCLGYRVIKSIGQTQNNKVVVHYYNGKTEYYINKLQCIFQLCAKYNIKIKTAQTQMRKPLSDGTGEKEMRKILELSSECIRDIERIINRYSNKKLRYFKNTVYKEIFEALNDNGEVIKLSQKGFNFLLSRVCKYFYNHYNSSIYIIDVIKRVEKIKFDELF